MIKVKRPFGYYDTALGIIGRTGENDTRTIDFDCTAALTEYPNANIICVCLRPGDDEPYTISLSTDGKHRVLTLASADLEKEGRLTLELRVVDGDKVLKSARFTGTVASSLQGEGDAPGTPVRDTLDRLDAEIKAAQAVVDDIRAKLDAGEFKGDKGDPGSDASVTAENIQSALGYAPVKDVQVAGSSVLVGDVANVPMADVNIFGVIKSGDATESGIWFENGVPKISYATDYQISSRNGQRKSIVCTNLDYAVKAAMCDGKGAAWTAAEQKAARERMGALGFDEESASINLYDPSLQTDETIAPHYYVSGAPYSSTNYDTMWNCTAPIPVKPNTMYTVGLVPAYHYVYESEDIMIEKPWGHAGNGCFFYDADGEYIKGTGEANTFTTPANCASIRFNYIIGKRISLAELNARCMLVEGNTLPTTYEPYSTTNSMTAIVDMLSKSGLSHYEYNNSVLTVYQNGTKIVYGYSGNNNIMMCKGYGLVGAFVPFTTDILSPMIITASQNADGDLEDTYRLTGGNHSYGQTSGTPSANTVLVEVFADGNPAEKSGLFNTLTLHARHEVQAWNTEKADGTGRAVLIEDDYITWDGKRMNAEIHLTPTENVVISEYYGLQLAEINSCNVYGGKVKKNIATGGYSDEVPYFIEGICNGFRIRMHLDETGLGKYTYNTSAIKYSKNDYKKAYFRPIGESHSFTVEDCLWLRGYFEIIPS